MSRKVAKIRVKKCKSCDKYFDVVRPLQMVCSALCGYNYSKKLITKKEAKDWNEKKKKIKDKLMGVPEYKKILQVKINTIIRLIDKGQKCMSCNSTGNVAGHYHSVGANPALRYHVDNIHIQEISCNNEKGGNTSKYATGLLDTYGRWYSDIVIYELPLRYRELKPTINELKEYIDRANEFIKKLKHEDKIYETNDRLRLRGEAHNYLGIYTSG